MPLLCCIPHNGYTYADINEQEFVHLLVSFRLCAVELLMNAYSMTIAVMLT